MSDLKQFDPWLTGDDGPAALVIRQYLESVEGPDGVIFPPTFAAETEGEKGDYNIDYFNGTFAAKIAYQHQGAEKLELRTVEELQGQGLGPKTVQALRDLLSYGFSLGELRTRREFDSQQRPGAIFNRHKARWKQSRAPN